MTRRRLTAAVTAAALVLNGVLYAFASSADVFWRLDRSAGAVTFVLMTGTVVLGVLRPVRMWVAWLHADVALLAIVFATAHVVSTILGEHTSLGPGDALLPFSSAYREPWVGLGVVSGYVYLAVVASSWPLRRAPRNWWTWLHRTIYVAWVLALVHSLGAGSDAGSGPYIGLDVIAVGAVALSVAMRMRRRVAPPPHRSVS